ncbi:uncharacterized protein LOC134704957 [Mytilus trossulus]|uniref:uncharacterized protein LOC134704957 n=1 Tax=Mytilus trossulus TaxID=6551 RepID=UPI0030075884
MHSLYFLLIVLISLCYTYGENSFSGHVCSRKIVKYRTSYYCSCKRLWWCCGRSARNTPYYASEMVCCPGWMHTGDKNCSTAIVVKSQQNTTEALSQDNTTTEAGINAPTSTQLLTSEEVTTILPATTMEFKTNDDMSTTSSMTTPMNNKQTTILEESMTTPMNNKQTTPLEESMTTQMQNKQTTLEENDEVLFQDTTSTEVRRTTPTSTETMTSEESSTMLTATTEDFKTNEETTTMLTATTEDFKTNEETTTMLTATTEDFKTNDDMTSTSPITTTRNNKQTKQPQVEANGSTEFVCPETFGYFADSTDCTKFYLCSWNDEYSFDCPPGTHWNQTITTCDFGDDC